MLWYTVIERINMFYLTVGYSKCPCCGYYGFNGQECFDCGYKA